jgi:tetratricopeptide (TPR) repeat protein
MNGDGTESRFDTANRLWFADGRARAALDEYIASAEAAPTDPVVLFQLARALRAFGHEDEARDALRRAMENAHRLNERGVELLEAEMQRPPGGYRFSCPVPLDELDSDRLEQRDLSDRAWLEIGSAAEERGMFGLAAVAYSHAGGLRELYDDANEMRNRAASELNRLQVMRSGRAQT